MYSYPSPVGPLLLASCGDALCLCDWDARPCAEHTPVIDAAIRELDEYFAGRRTSFTLPVEPEGTPFQRAVWQELTRIPYGTTISYKELARRLHRPTAVRAVARAVGQNPLSIFLPCHRVIGTDGSLTGYAGGLEAKRFLLRLEMI